jgi:Domain of unknown function (DUF4340)
MRPRTLLVLFVIVAGLSAFIWFYERDLPSTDERREAEKKILDVEKDEVRQIVLEVGDRVVRLERQGMSYAEEGEPEASEGKSDSKLLDSRTWRLVEPIVARADERAVNGLLDALKGLERERSLSDFDAAAVGLKEPRARIRLISVADEQTLLVGSEVPASSSLIVQREGSDEAAVTRRDVWTQVDKPAGDWRSKRIFTGNQSDVIRVALQNAERRVLLERRAGDFWIEAPVEDRARQQRVNELLGSLASLEAASFVDGPVSLEELGLEPPLATVEIALRDGAPNQRLELGLPVAASAVGDGDSKEATGGEASRRYARFEGQVVELGDALDEALSRESQEWQADRWSAFDVWQIDGARIRSEGAETVLARAAGDWKRGDETIGYEPVSDFLYAVDEVTSEHLAPADPEAWGEPILEIELSGDQKEEKLAVYAARGGLNPATVEDRDFALLLDPATVEGLRAKLEAVRSAESKVAEPETP